MTDGLDQTLLAATRRHCTALYQLSPLWAFRSELTIRGAVCLIDFSPCRAFAQAQGCAVFGKEFHASETSNRD